MIVRFESVAEYARACQEAGRGAGARYWNENDNGHRWDLGISSDKAVEFCENGDPSLAPVMTDACNRVRDFAVANVPQTSYQPDYYGGRVSVGSYLTGDPMCMRRKVKREVAAPHVSVYVSTACSAGITAEDMLKRGAAIVGLLEYFQACNIGVDLFLVDDLYGRTDGDLHTVTRVESRPLDLSVSAFAIAHPAYTRKLGFAYGLAKDGFNGSWSRSFENCSYNASRYEEIMRPKLGMLESDIYVPPVYYSDIELIKNPEAWIKTRIKDFSGQEV